MEMRELTLEAMQIALRAGLTEYAKELGQTSQRLDERIKTFDYSKQDALLDKIISIQKRT